MQTSVLIRSAMLGLLITVNTGAFAEELVKQIDLRSPDGKAAIDQFYIVFNAYKVNVVRGSFAGHAYVGFGKDDSEKQLCEYSAYGLYPKKGIGWVGPVPANMVSDTWKKSDFRLIVRVDRATYQELEKFKSQYNGANGEGQYELGGRDCVTFAAQVAKQLKLHVPERKDNMFPSSFLKSLIESNKDRAGNAT